ncbi:translocation protein SEC63-like protein [Leptotrombidium deliense]|uniref:Translocation protein SEC63-like protein n=1 Tax=Leptotrombidium deliense TaxID=299467 RepID=A0A443SDU5_9ACAR|nr:translocation protein SEC63-like protein [Leptotrombidium deliense]
MAGSKFQYDEILIIFGLRNEDAVSESHPLATVIITTRPEENVKDKNKCHCEQCGIKSNYLNAKEPWRKAKHRTIKILLVLGWLAMLACAYKVAHLQHDYINWDPFEILGIDPGSSTAEIKKAYRKLSLLHHPDKGGDERKFLKISKAYAALTDEEARKNWEMYGNPDGPGATSFGIALPSWIVEKENSILVLGLYALVFMIALPTIVGIWWYRSVKYGGDQVLIDTSQLYYYFIHKSPSMVLRRVLMILAASLEFEKGHNNEVIERPSDNVEVPQLIKELPNLGEKNKERPLCFPYSVKARALLYAHLSRLKLPPNTLEVDKIQILKKCPYLIHEFVQCVAQMTMLALSGRVARTPHLDTLENAMKLSPLIVQALWDSKSSLLQLPHINEDILRHFTTKRRNVRNVNQLAYMKNDERRSMLRNLSDDQYEDIINVLGNLPLLDVEVKSEVLDDEDSGTITAGAIVTVTVTLKRKPMRTLFDQTVIHDSTEDVHEEEDAEQVDKVPNGDVENHDSPKGRKPKVWEKNKGKKKGGKAGKNKKKVNVVNKKVTAKSQQNTSEKPTATNTVSESKTTVSKVQPKEDSEVESDIETDESHASDSDVPAGDNRHEEGSDEEEWDKVQNRITKKEKVLETKSRVSHSVHCPYYPDDKQEYWWIYLADRKRHLLTTIPVLMTNLVDEEQVELKFTAPSKPCVCSYSVIVRSDSYLDVDVVKSIKLDVKEAKEIVNHPQWDMSEEEEEAAKEEDSAVEDSDLLATDDEDSFSE